MNQDRHRFTLQLTLRDNYGGDSLHIAIDIDAVVRISTRAVDEIKAGVGSFDGTVHLMRQRQFRKDTFVRECARLGALLAERMEDAEGWHDSDRIEPARKQLGGRWKAQTNHRLNADGEEDAYTDTSRDYSGKQVSRCHRRGRGPVSSRRHGP